jgi:hypothetical protein
VEWGRINNESSSRSILPKQYERADHREPFLTHSERKIAQPARLLWAIQRVFVSKVWQQNAHLWLIMLISYATMLNHYLIRGSPADRLQKLKDSHLRAGADGGDRTHTTLRSLDFESSASASSATSANKQGASFKLFRQKRKWHSFLTDIRSHLPPTARAPQSVDREIGLKRGE